MKKYIENLRYDIPAGVVVFFVAVPLCLGIALASGAPLFAGIIAGFVGGILVGAISGSQLGVSGPAAGLAVIVLSAIQELGAFEVFLLAVVLSGIIQIVAGIFKAGIIGYYFPSSVIKGMLAAIGIIIILKQIPHAFGYDKDPEGELRFVQMDGENTFSELFNMLNYITPGALVIALVSITILIVWEQKFMKRLKFTQIIQGPIVAVVAGIVLTILFKDHTLLGLKSGHTVNLPVPEGATAFFQQFTFPQFSAIGNKEVWIVAATLAVVASLETLLCVEATDNLDPQKRITPTNRELIAQGVGNAVSGLIGGLPVTQVIVRSSTNIQSGGRTKVSAIFHGLMILGTVMLIPNILNLIPLASLAAILLMVGYKLAKPSLFLSQFKSGRVQYIPFMVTVVGIVFTDLLVGIMMGMSVGIFQILYENSKYSYYMHSKEDAGRLTIELSEHVSFLNKASILQLLDNIEEGRQVIIDGTKTVYIHPDVVEVIENFLNSNKHHNDKIEVRGLDVVKIPVEQ